MVNLTHLWLILLFRQFRFENLTIAMTDVHLTIRISLDEFLRVWIMDFNSRQNTQHIILVSFNTFGSILGLFFYSSCYFILSCIQVLDMAVMFFTSFFVLNNRSIIIIFYV